MNWITKFIRSSIGKKVFMATTGILLSFFLLMHLIGNQTLFGGEEVFNSYGRRDNKFLLMEYALPQPLLKN